MNPGSTTPVFDRWEGVVFDLDGTLVDLVVDWDAVESELEVELAEAGIRTDGRSTWELLAEARDAGQREIAEGVIAPAEMAGAREAVRLPLADHVTAVNGPVGVCSLNCEDACRTALDAHDLTGEIDAVVGRDSLDWWKPDPKPLLEAVSSLDLAPEDAVFIGDSASDRTTAERAGVEFRTVRETVAQLR